MGTWFRPSGYLVQCVSCVSTFVVNTSNQKRQNFILLGSHVLATMTANYSMAYTEAASTQAMKLAEPVFMCIAELFVFHRMPSLQAMIGIPLIIFGSLKFAMLNSTYSLATPGIFLAFISNIVLAIRNIMLKTLHGPESSTSSLKFRPSYAKHVWYCLLLGILVASLALTKEENLTLSTTFTIFLLFSSGIFHVVYSYISVNVALKVMDIVSHSVVNIFKRLFVVIMLYLSGKQQASTGNFFGLGVAVLGLFLFADSKQTTPSKKITIKNILVVLLCTSCVISIPMSTRYISRAGIKISYLRQETDSHSIFNVQERPIDARFADFLKWNLTQHPFETNTLSQNLTNAHDIIKENQRVLLNLLDSIIGTAPNVMLMDIPDHDNKGDSAITVGEVMIIKKLKKQIVYHCETLKCYQQKNINRSIIISQRYPIEDIVILLHGGGNLLGYKLHDKLRHNLLDVFPKHKFILLSQSIWLHDDYVSHLNFCIHAYSNKTNLNILIRDKQSLAIAREHFRGVKLYLAPDMAFGIGPVPRMLPPYFDIIWLRRTDNETSKYPLPVLPKGVTVHVSDWYDEWALNSGATDLERAFIKAHDGFSFLQRGRVVITDRLHGHILSVLMDTPHVLIDNPPFYKLSSFDNTWTASLHNKVMASGGTDAVEQALAFLARFNQTLPQIVPSTLRD
ncbi:uncharacterized protein LOC131943881 [Physella acuta]|uniref:uncharacterized protein LOC131943881 n=1 Tax=Physella acuta TaxID=109671 RepID=UPI0027DD5A3B|nr:uncharacterized protein LOC131943881 [Physella acuta]